MSGDAQPSGWTYTKALSCLEPSVLPTCDLAPHRESPIGMDASWLITESHSWAYPPHFGVYCAPHTWTELPWECSKQQVMHWHPKLRSPRRAQEAVWITDCVNYSARLYQGFCFHPNVMDYMNNPLFKFTFLAVDNQHCTRETEFCSNKKGQKTLKYHKILLFFEKNVVWLGQITS